MTATMGIACITFAAAHASAQTLFPAPSGAINWTRYTSVEACREALERVRQLESFNVWRDTLPLNFMEPLSQQSIGTARDCLRQHPLARADSRDLPAMLDLALVANDDALYDAIIARQLAEVPIPSHRARARVVLQGMTALQRARPLRVELAQRYMRMADSLWPDAVIERARIHTAPVFLASAMHDVDAIISGLSAARAIARLPSGEPLTSEDQEILKLFDFGLQSNVIFRDILRDGPTDTLVAQLRMTRGGLYGALFDSLGGEIYYKVSPTDARMTTMSGHPMVLVQLNQDCGANCFASYGILRRIHAQFPSLPMLVVAGTKGTFRNRKPPGTQEEAAWIRDYVWNELRLNVPVLIDTIPHMFRPPPDGRRVVSWTDTELWYRKREQPEANPDRTYRGSMYRGDVLLLDPKGRVLEQTLIPETEWIFKALIERMLKPS